MTCHRRTLLACAALGALSAALPAAAQDSWPTKTVRLIVPYAAGGFADTRARKIADALGKTLGQPVIVDNRAGAGGVTGTDANAKATDGHTFGFGSPAPLVTNPMLMKKMPYDAEKAFKPIILIETAPLFLSTAPNQSLKSLKELLDHARAKARRKGADLLVVNPVGEGRGFAVPDNEVTLLDAGGEVLGRAAGSKEHVADAVWDAVVPLLPAR